MHLTADGDWLVGVRRLDSPNQEVRPDPRDISLIVVHGISLPPGEFGGPWIEQLFTNRLDLGAHSYFAQIGGVRVSAHVVIHRDGEVVQFVPFSRRAWHAGQSRFGEREACNDFSIGIELEGADDVPYTTEQYRRLSRLIRLLQAAYPRITTDRIVGHCDVAPERKTDPGPAFDWGYLHALLRDDDALA